MTEAMDRAINDAYPIAQDEMKETSEKVHTEAFVKARKRLEAMHRKKAKQALEWEVSVSQMTACERWNEDQWRSLETLPDWAIRTCLRTSRIGPGDSNIDGWLERAGRKQAAEVGITIRSEERPRIGMTTKGWPEEAVTPAPLGVALACSCAGQPLTNNAQWGAAHAIEWEITIEGGSTTWVDAAKRTNAQAQKIRERLAKAILTRAIEKIEREGTQNPENSAKTIEQRWKEQGGKPRGNATLETDVDGTVVWRIPIDHPIEAIASIRRGKVDTASGREMKMHEALLIRSVDIEGAWIQARVKRKNNDEQTRKWSQKTTRTVGDAIKGSKRKPQGRQQGKRKEMTR